MNIFNSDVLSSGEFIKDESIDLIITSPPYNIGKNYEFGGDNKDNYIDWLVERAIMMTTKLKSNGSFWLNLGYRKLEGGNIPIVFQIYDKVPMFLNQMIVWNYDAGMAYKKRFSHRSEQWLWFIKDKDNYTFNSDDVRDIKLNKTKDKRNNPLGKLPEDVWYFPIVKGNSKEREKHPAQFPQL